MVAGVVSPPGRLVVPFYHLADCALFSYCTSLVTGKSQQRQLFSHDTSLALRAWLMNPVAG